MNHNNSINDFDIIAFIQKKKNCQVLSEVEIDQFINRICAKKIPDYQITAWLMAVAINGMNEDETYYLTKAILNSGHIYQLPVSDKIVVDKHSTGGIGDKVSLILLPILVACGLNVAKLSGRGLGYTGGTIDKLNSLGVQTNLNITTAFEKLKETGIFIIEQTKEIAPADKILYSLRDVTATVDCIPLIVASIMAKKLALKTDYLFLDVKYGSGSFCLTKQSAEILAAELNKVAKRFQVDLVLHISSMQQPLGHTVGNLIELTEAYHFLKNQPVANDLATLIETLAINILLKTQLFDNEAVAKQKYQQVLSDQTAFNVACNWFEKFNGDLNLWKNNQFFQPKYHVEIRANTSGYFDLLDNQKIGYIINHIGAGRQTKDDQIDYHAGLYFHKKINDPIKANDCLITIYSSNPIDQNWIKKLNEQIVIRNQPIILAPLLELWTK